jgi:hypothetical protein
MRLLLIAVATFSLGAGATLAQTGIGGSSPSGAASGLPQGSPAPLTTADVLPPLRLLPGLASSTASPTGVSPQRQSLSRPQPRQNGHDSAFADCMQMWDSGTHMTKQEWSRSCKRVQARLDSLNVDAIMPKPKAIDTK